jgi:hypothetical protein
MAANRALGGGVVAYKQWWNHSTIPFTFGVVSGCLKTGDVERSAHVVYSKLQPAVRCDDGWNDEVGHSVAEEGRGIDVGGGAGK